jgi:hypothetical protein
MSMRNITSNFILLFLFFSCIVTAQDVIIKNDKTEIKGKVYELTDSDIKYKKKELMDGPIYSIKKAEVFMIIYANGIKEYIEVSAPTNNTSNYSNGNAVSNTGNTPFNRFVTTVAAPAGSQTLSNQNKPVVTETTKTGSMYFAFGESMIDINATSMFKSTNFGFGLNYGMLIPQVEDVPVGSFVYPSVVYKYPIPGGFNLWASAGPTWTYIPSFEISGYGYSQTIPSVSDFSFTFQLGGDIFFGKKKSWGLTAYTYEFDSILGGLIFKV